MVFADESAPTGPQRISALLRYPIRPWRGAPLQDWIDAHSTGLL
jgi:hypothetical protein